MVEGFHSGNGVVGGGISCHQVSSQAGISKESSEDSAEKAQKNRQHRIVEHKLLPGDTQGIESADHGTFLVDGVNDKDRDDIGDQDQDDQTRRQAYVDVDCYIIIGGLDSGIVLGLDKVGQIFYFHGKVFIQEFLGLVLEVFRSGPKFLAVSG